MSTGLDLGALKELCEKATPGPWEVDPSRWSAPGWPEETGYLRVVAGEPNPISGIRPKVVSTDGAPEGDEVDRQHYIDAGFIAAARSAVPALIAEVERLRADRDRARSVAAALEQELAVKDEAIEQIKHEIDDWPDDAVENVTNILARLAARIEAANRDYDEKER